MFHGLAVLLIVLLGVGAACASAAETHAILKGTVVAVDPDRGAFALQQGDGTRSTLRADPAFLRDLRVGESLEVVVDGTTARLFARPTSPGPEAQEGRRSS